MPVKYEYRHIFGEAIYLLPRWEQILAWLRDAKDAHVVDSHAILLFVCYIPWLLYIRNPPHLGTSNTVHSVGTNDDVACVLGPILSVNNQRRIYGWIDADSDYFGSRFDLGFVL